MKRRQAQGRVIPRITRGCRFRIYTKRRIRGTNIDSFTINTSRLYTRITGRGYTRRHLAGRGPAGAGVPLAGCQLRDNLLRRARIQAHLHFRGNAPGREEPSAPVTSRRRSPFAPSHKQNYIKNLGVRMRPHQARVLGTLSTFTYKHSWPRHPSPYLAAGPSSRKHNTDRSDRASTPYAAPKSQGTPAPTPSRRQRNAHLFT